MKLEALEKTFDINVAFIGHKNVGKTTLINALLQDNYSPVGIGGSTFGVNSFRIFTAVDPSRSGSKDETNPSVSSETVEEMDDWEVEWSIIPENPKTTKETIESLDPCIPENLYAAKDTLKIISNDNRLRQTFDETDEKTFDVKLSNGLCDMRNDANLVLMDIPGTNCSDKNCKYLNYLSRNWAALDCVVFVFDVLQDVTEQASLLKLVKSNLAAQKTDTSILVVCNKVDDTDNPEVAAVVKEIQAIVQNESIQFFFPLSAEYAYVYRAASGLSFDSFQLLDVALVDKIGCNEVARLKWTSLALKEKYQMAFEAISDGTKYEKCLASTNFPSFLEAFKQCVGGDKRQKELIWSHSQLNLAYLRAKTLSATTVAEARENIRKLEHLGFSTTSFDTNNYFWSAFLKYHKESIKLYKSEMDFKCLHLSMTQLIEFDALLTDVRANEAEHWEVLNAMKSLVWLQINELLKHASSWSNNYALSDSFCAQSNPIYYNSQNECWEHIHVADSSNCDSKNKKNDPPKNDAQHWNHVCIGRWQNKYTYQKMFSANNPVSGKSVWFHYSLVDFKTAIDSILMMSYHEAFCLNFGPEKIRMDSFLRQYDALCTSSSSSHSECANMCAALAGKYDDDGRFVPNNKDLHNVFVHVRVPDHISNPKHWGHLVWMFCTFMDSKRP